MTAILTAPTASTWSDDQWASWRDDVRRLAADRDAVILAHNYQAPANGSAARRHSITCSRAIRTWSTTASAWCG